MYALENVLKIIRTVKEMQSWSKNAKESGECIAFVPTMGALHEGHLALVKHAKKKSDKVVVSIFVNPTQFGPKEDFEKYPRDEELDLNKCKMEDVDCVFMPDANEMYPNGFEITVKAGEIADGLCGEKRPKHFDGVVTVVSKLFDAVLPDKAIFGEKDFQQLRVIEQMTNDLNLPIEIIGSPTVREKDGLAMSSRNKYLNSDERKRALCLINSILKAKEMASSGEANVEFIKSEIKKILDNAKAKIDYIEIVDSKNLKPLAELNKPARLILAVFIGKTRLIDNAQVE